MVVARKGAGPPGGSDNRWRDGQIFHVGLQPGTVLDCGGTLSLFLSVAKSGFGRALASMSVLVMLFVLSLKEALAVLLPMFLITSIGVFFIWYKHCHWRLVGSRCLFALVGQFVGWLVFDHLADYLLKLLHTCCRRHHRGKLLDQHFAGQGRDKNPCLDRETSLKTRFHLVRPVRQVKFRVLFRRHTSTDFPVAPPPQQRGLCRLIQHLFHGDRSVKSTTLS